VDLVAAFGLDKKDLYLHADLSVVQIDLAQVREQANSFWKVN